MTLNKIKLIALLATMGCTVNLYAAEGDPVAVTPQVVDGGKVHFKGEFIASACAVENDSQGQTVTLGQYSTNSIKKVGDTTTNVPFNINLVDCDKGAFSNVSIAFSAPSSDGQLLEVDGSGNNGAVAQGIGIELLDNSMKIIQVTGSDFSTPQTLYDGQNSLNFFARYKATKAVVTPGQANATATFKVKYQ
jgi:major type 1 subunit fimbrin (pilin)